MNTTRTRTRRGAAILFSGVLVLGGLAVAGDASAEQVVDGNPTCPAGYEFVEKKEDPSGTYTFDLAGATATITVGTYTDQTDPNENNAIIERTIPTNDYQIIVKGGSGAIIYGPGDSPPLHAPAVSSDKWPTISHFDLCWNKPAPEPELGELQVTKKVTGGAPTGHQYEICIVGPDQETTKECQTIKGPGVVTFTDLVPGTYLVTETDPESTNPGSDYEVTIVPKTVTVTSEVPATAEVTNAYTPETPETPKTPEVPKVPETPTVEALPPTAPVTPAAPVAPAAAAEVAAEATLPATGSEGGLAAIAAILVTTGIGLTLLGKRRGTQQA